jgi:hypothetical protein
VTKILLTTALEWFILSEKGGKKCKDIVLNAEQKEKLKAPSQ